MISNKYKCIFTHITKTAGRSIEAALEETGDHNTLEKDKSKIEENLYNIFFKWTIVRNPFDRFVSMYFFGKQICRDCLGDFSTSFDEWIINLFDNNDSKSLIISQNEWINVNGKIDCDFIGKFENIKKDFLFISKKIKCLNKLPHYNKTNRKPYYFYYNKKTIRLVEERCEKDLEIFKYSYKSIKFL